MSKDNFIEHFKPDPIDDDQLDRLRRLGRMLTGEMKKHAITLLTDIVSQHSLHKN